MAGLPTSFSLANCGERIIVTFKFKHHFLPTPDIAPEDHIVDAVADYHSFTDAQATPPDELDATASIWHLLIGDQQPTSSSTTHRPITHSACTPTLMQPAPPTVMPIPNTPTLMNHPIPANHVFNYQIRPFTSLTSFSMRNKCQCAKWTQHGSQHARTHWESPYHYPNIYWGHH